MAAFEDFLGDKPKRNLSLIVLSQSPSSFDHSEMLCVLPL